MFWADEDEEKKDASWEEISEYYKDCYRHLTFSEHDQYEIVCFYNIEQDVPAPKNVPLLDFVPINFLTNFFFHSHKGNLKFLRTL